MRAVGKIREISLKARGVLRKFTDNVSERLRDDESTGPVEGGCNRGGRTTNFAYESHGINKNSLSGTS